MKKFTQKLAAYSAAAGAMLAFGQTANAQVVYTDVDPDESFTAGSYNLDLNNDATTDFVLNQASNYGGWETVRILPDAGAGFLSTQYPPAATWTTYIFAQMLSDGQAINDAGDFNASSTNNTMSLGFVGSITAGPWVDQTEQFLGLRFTLDGGTSYYYGWARVSVNAQATEFTIHDYAYESTVDTEILAGQMPEVSIETLSDQANVNVFPNPSNGIFSINPDLQDFEISVKDITGKTITDKIISNTIDLTSFGSGMYFIQIKTGDKIITERVVVN